MSQNHDPSHNDPSHRDPSHTDPSHRDPSHNSTNHDDINGDSNQNPRVERSNGEGKDEPGASGDPRAGSCARRPKNQRKQDRPLPQRVPAIPATKFVRFLIDYIGGGRYQLSVQGHREIPKPIAVADDVAPLLDHVFERAEPGNEVVVAPVVALTHVVAMPTALLGLLQKVNADPFNPIGSVIVIPSGQERDEFKGKARDAVERGAEQPSEDGAEDNEAKQADANAASGMTQSAETYLERLAAAQNAKHVPEHQRKLFARDARSGGRLGWIFESRSGGPLPEGDSDKKGDDDQAPPEAN